MTDEKQWVVYLVTCADGTLYTGVTNDLERRIEQHNKGNKGAKYTRTRRPVTLFKSFVMPDKSSALKEEYRIKQLSRDEKLKL